MNEFWILILLAFFAANLLHKAESVKVKMEELPFKTFDEIFGEGWWDKGEAEDLKTLASTNFGQNVHHQINRQNTKIGQIAANSTDQLGQIEPNSTDQLGQIEPNSTDQLGQIEPNSTDQNPLLTESDHSDNAKNGEEQNEISSNKKHIIIDKFYEMKEEFKQKGKYSTKEWVQINKKIAKHLKVSRAKIYEWKKEFGLNLNTPKNERQNLIEKFDQMKAELRRDGFKSSYKNELDKTVAKGLGLSDRTIYKWKQKLGQTAPNKHSHSKQMELMKRYYEIKDKTPKISDEEISKMLKIVRSTLFRWKKQFKRPQFQPNAVDFGHSVEENAAENIQ